MRKKIFNFTLAMSAFAAAAMLTMSLASCSDDKKEDFKEDEEQPEDPEGTTYNFFDPADCDEEGWLWLDTQAKIDKYVGEGKKIQLINGKSEVEDPDFPGEFLPQTTEASAEVIGYNTKGELGGEGSKTGGIVLPLDDHGSWVVNGGGILVQMPDCAQFDIYMSQELEGIYTWIEAGRGNLSADELRYIWSDDDWSWDPDVQVGPVPGITYAGYDMNIQDIKLDLNYGEGDPDILQIYGPKGEPRTAGFYNYSKCPMIIQGIRIKTFTNVNK